MRKVAPLAVLAGAVIDFVTSVTFSAPLYVWLRLTHRPHAFESSVQFRLMQFTIGCACSVFGAYVAAALARRAQIVNGLSSAVLPALASGAAMLRTKISTPWVWLVLGVVATPLAGALGGWLALLQARRSQPFP